MRSEFGFNLLIELFVKWKVITEWTTSRVHTPSSKREATTPFKNSLSFTDVIGTEVAVRDGLNIG